MQSTHKHLTAPNQQGDPRCNAVPQHTAVPVEAPTQYALVQYAPVQYAPSVPALHVYQYAPLRHQYVPLRLRRGERDPLLAERDEERLLLPDRLRDENELDRPRDELRVGHRARVSTGASETAGRQLARNGTAPHRSYINVYFPTKILSAQNINPPGSTFAKVSDPRTGRRHTRGGRKAIRCCDDIQRQSPRRAGGRLTRSGPTSRRSSCVFCGLPSVIWRASTGRRNRHPCRAARWLPRGT